MTQGLSVGALRPLVKHPGESLLLGVHFGPLLGTGERLQTPLPVEVSPEGLLLGPVLVNASPFPDGMGGIVAAGQGLQVRVSGGTNGTDFTLTLGAATTQGNTRIAVCRLLIRSE